MRSGWRDFLLRWEKKAVCVNVVLAILLVAVVLKIGSWMDLNRYNEGQLRITAIKNYRAVIGLICAEAERAASKRIHRRKHSWESTRGEGLRSTAGTAIMYQSTPTVTSVEAVAVSEQLKNKPQ